MHMDDGSHLASPYSPWYPSGFADYGFPVHTADPYYVPDPNFPSVGQNFTPVHTPFMGHHGGSLSNLQQLQSRRSLSRRRSLGGLSANDRPDWANHDEHGHATFDTTHYRPLQNVLPSPFGTPRSLSYTGIPSKRPYSERNLAPKSKSFRPDYVGKSGWAGLVGKITRNKDRPEGDDINRQLHWLLDFHPSNRGGFSYKEGETTLRYDLRREMTPYSLVKPNMMNNMLFNNVDFLQVATTPPTDHMTLVHPLLPWYIKVYNTNENGITVGDVLTTLFREMNILAKKREFWAEDIDRRTRGTIEDTWYARVWNTTGMPGTPPGPDIQLQQQLRSGATAEILGGVKRVDWLGRSCIFCGLVRQRGGLWEIKTEDAVDLT